MDLVGRLNVFILFLKKHRPLDKCACHPCTGARLISVSFQFCVCAAEASTVFILFEALTTLLYFHPQLLTALWVFVNKMSVGIFTPVLIFYTSVIYLHSV